MDLASTFSRDDDKVENGKWFDLDGESRIKVRYWKNENFVQYISQKVNTSSDLPDDIQDDVSEEIMHVGIAKHIIVDWENIEINGEETDYDEEIGQKVLEQLPEFAEVVISYAQKLSEFRDDQKEIDIKN